MEVEGRLYISVPYIYPASPETCDILSSEQPEESLIYSEGTDWSCSVILICCVIFLFAAFMERLSFLSFSFLSNTKPPECSLLRKLSSLISSPSLWANRLDEGMEGWAFFVISGVLGWWGNTQPSVHHGSAVKSSCWLVLICCLKIKFICLGYLS